jgi:hypothetical protein
MDVLNKRFIMTAIGTSAIVRFFPAIYGVVPN